MKPSKYGKNTVGVASLGLEGEPFVTLAQGSTILIVSFIIASVLKYGFHFSLGRLLDPADYGMLGIGEAILGVLALFIGAAFPLTVTRYLSRGKYGVIKASMLGNFLIGLIVCSLLYAFFTSGSLKLEGSGYHYIIIVVIAAVLIMSFGNVYVGALQGAFRFKEVGILRCVNGLALVVVGILLAVTGFGAAGAIMGYVLAALLTLGLGAYYSKALKPLGGKWIDSRLYLFATPLFIGILGTQLLMNVDILGVKFFSPDAVSDVLAGYYKAVIVWARIPVFMIMAMIGAFFPFISRYTSDREKVESYSSKFIKYAFIFIFPVNLTFMFIPTKVITLLYPEAYAQGGNALAILSLGMFLVVLITILATVFQAADKPTLPAMVLGSAVVFQIVLLYILVPRYGIAGAAMSTTISCALALCVLGLQYIQSYSTHLKPLNLGKIALASLLLVGFIALFPLQNKGLVLLCMVVGYALYVFTLIVLRFFQVDDAQSILSGILPSSNKLHIMTVKVVSVLNGIGRR